MSEHEGLKHCNTCGENHPQPLPPLPLNPFFLSQLRRQKASQTVEENQFKF